MATKSKTREQIKQSKIQAIENNINLIEVLYHYFKGQVLEMDLRDFCLRFSLFETERQFQNAIKKLISKDVLKVEKLVNTNNNVIIAKGIVYTYFKEEGKTTRYSVDTVVKNSYLSYILQNMTKLNNKISIEENAKNISEYSTFFATKRDVMSCYKMFYSHLSEMGKAALGDSLYMEERRKVALKNIRKPDIKDRVIICKQTLQTLRERDIYISRFPVVKEGGDTLWRYSVFILNTNSAFTLVNVSQKIALVLAVFYEQLDHKHMDCTVDFIVCTKDEETKRKLERNFVTPRKNRHEDVNLDKSINKELKKTDAGYGYMEYVYKKKNTNAEGQNIYILENIYPPMEKKLETVRIYVNNTEIATRYNTDLKTKALVEKNKERQRDKLIEELRKQGLLREDLTEKQIENIKKNIEI